MDLSMASSLGGVISNVIATDSANQVSRIKAGAESYIRGKNNEVVAEENKRDAVLTGFQRWKQSVYNSRVTQNAATDQDMLTTNYNRQRDVRARGSFATQVQYAEQSGRMQAQAAASGVTGSVVDVLNMTLQMKQGQQDTQFAEATRQMDYDEGQREFTTYWADMDKMDTSIILDNQRVSDPNISYTQQAPLISAVKPSDVKNIAQGLGNMNFSFNQPKPASLPFAGEDVGDNSQVLA